MIKYLTQERFEDVYKDVPRTSVDIIIRDKQGRFLLTKRAVQPRIGNWHTAGGSLLYGERISEAVDRVCNKELGFRPIVMLPPRGIVEIIEPFEHTISSFVECIIPPKAEIKLNHEASEYKFFSKDKLPKVAIKEQMAFLKDL